jgi:hypothetical protein
LWVEHVVGDGVEVGGGRYRRHGGRLYGLVIRCDCCRCPCSCDALYCWAQSLR